MTQLVLVFACVEGLAAPVDLRVATVDAPGCDATARQGVDSTGGTLTCGSAEWSFDLGAMAGTRVDPRGLASCAWSEVRPLGGGLTRFVCVRASGELVVTVNGLRPGSALPANFWGADVDRERLLAAADSYAPVGQDLIVVPIPDRVELADAGLERRARMSEAATPRTLAVTPGLQVGAHVVWNDVTGVIGESTLCDPRAAGSWGLATAGEGLWAELQVFETAVGCAEGWRYTAEGYRVVWRGRSDG
jgi:hypothetical protein